MATRSQAVRALLFSLAAASLVGVGCGNDQDAPDPKPRGGAAPWRVTELRGSDPGGSGLSEYRTLRFDGHAVIVAGADYRQRNLRVATLDIDRRRWLGLETGPLWWRYGQSMVSTGEELIVWGGCCGPAGEGSKAEGAAYDPARHRWRLLPDSPLGGPRRHWHSAVWTGREMIVWGGTQHSRGGAAYDPDRNRWRLIPPAPIDPRIQHVALWTGSEMIVWGGVRSNRGELRGDACDRRLTDGAAFNPYSNEWRPIAQSPIRPGAPCEPQSSVGAWTGKDMIVSGVARLAAYDPRKDRWRMTTPAPKRVGPWGAVFFDGTEVIVAGVQEPGTTEDRTTGGAAYNPSGDSWRRLGPIPVPHDANGGRMSFAWTGRELIGWGGRGGKREFHSSGWIFRPSPARR